MSKITKKLDLEMRKRPSGFLKILHVHIANFSYLQVWKVGYVHSQVNFTSASAHSQFRILASAKNWLCALATSTNSFTLFKFQFFKFQFFKVQIFKFRIFKFQIFKFQIFKFPIFKIPIYKLQIFKFQISKIQI